jgi:hypothetical protein
MAKNKRLTSSPSVLTRKTVWLWAGLALLAGVALVTLWRNQNGVRIDITPPGEARAAVAVAKAFAATNGCVSPKLSSVRLYGGRWIITLSSSDGHFVGVQVSPEGEVVGYSGIR